MKIPQVIRDKPWTRKACREVIRFFVLLLLLLWVSVPGAFLRLVVVVGFGLVGSLLYTPYFVRIYTLYTQYIVHSSMEIPV